MFINKDMFITSFNYFYFSDDPTKKSNMIKELDDMLKDVCSIKKTLLIKSQIIGDTIELLSNMTKVKKILSKNKINDLVSTINDVIKIKQTNCISLYSK
jgi:hypothetical protein